jgi:hypothetical protein
LDVKQTERENLLLEVVMEILKFHYWYLRIAVMLWKYPSAIPIFLRRVRTLYYPMFKAKGLREVNHHLILEGQLKGLWK